MFNSVFGIKYKYILCDIMLIMTVMYFINFRYDISYGQIGSKEVNVDIFVMCKHHITCCVFTM